MIFLWVRQFINNDINTNNNVNKNSLKYPEKQNKSVAVVDAICMANSNFYSNLTLYGQRARFCKSAFDPMNSASAP